MGRMLPFDMTICGEPDIACTAPGHSHAVSIMDPGLRAWFGGCVAEANILRLNFHDLDGPLSPAHPAWGELAHKGVAVVLPGEAHVRAILGFGRTLRPGARLLIHCMAGISRSTAAAWMLACQARPGREAEMLAHVRRIRPQALPNRLMVRIADDVLGARGRLVRLRETL